MIYIIHNPFLLYWLWLLLKDSLGSGLLRAISCCYLYFIASWMSMMKKHVVILKLNLLILISWRIINCITCYWLTFWIDWDLFFMWLQFSLGNFIGIWCIVNPWRRKSRWLINRTLILLNWIIKVNSAASTSESSDTIVIVCDNGFCSLIVLRLYSFSWVKLSYIFIHYNLGSITWQWRLWTFETIWVIFILRNHSLSSLLLHKVWVILLL